MPLHAVIVMPLPETFPLSDVCKLQHSIAAKINAIQAVGLPHVVTKSYSGLCGKEKETTALLF